MSPLSLSTLTVSRVDPESSQPSVQTRGTACERHAATALALLVIVLSALSAAAVAVGAAG
ncbi:MAG TPA: hypothetical protein VJO99_07960 [Burkholderiaceae bacterium]|nr:hypothetical protein [Burkholderiaceae bacterium]